MSRFIFSGLERNDWSASVPLANVAKRRKAIGADWSASVPLANVAKRRKPMRALMTGGHVTGA